MDTYTARSGLTGTQMSIIDFLGESQNHTQRDIDTEFDNRPSITTKILRQMEANGLVVIKRDTGDSRQRIIAPTAKARDLQTAVRAYIDGQQKAMKR